MNSTDYIYINIFLTKNVTVYIFKTIQNKNYTHYEII
jgi:hypothetical protein